jgi:hypothetical protein
VTCHETKLWRSGVVVPPRYRATPTATATRQAAVERTAVSLRPPRLLRRRDLPCLGAERVRLSYDDADVLQGREYRTGAGQGSGSAAVRKADDENPCWYSMTVRSERWQTTMARVMTDVQTQSTADGLSLFVLCPASSQMGSIQTGYWA